MQPPLSLIRPHAADDVIPWCREHGTGVIVYSPMQAGLLSGAFDRARVDMLDADDWRRSSDQFQEPTLSKNLALVERLRPIADELGTSLPALSIAWTVSVPGVTGAIVGARSAAQVDGWIAAGDLELDPDVLVRISAAVSVG